MHNKLDIKELLNTLAVYIDQLWTPYDDTGDEEAYEETQRQDAAKLLAEFKSTADKQKQSEILDKLEAELAHYEENMGERVFDSTRQVSKRQYLETIDQLRQSIK